MVAGRRHGVFTFSVLLVLLGTLVAGPIAVGAAELAQEPVPAAAAAQGATNDNGQRKLVITGDGTLELIYVQLEDETAQIFVTSSADGGKTWSEPVRLSRPGVAARLGSLAEDAAGGLHAAWVDYETVGHVWYSVRRDGVWSEASKVSPGPTYAGFPVMAVEEERVHLLWYSSIPDEAYDVGSRYEIVHVAKTDDEWGSPTVVSVGGLDALNPTVARDRSGVVHTAWYERDVGRYQAHYAFLDDGEWRVPAVISTDTSDALGVAMDVGPDGTVRLVWEQSTDRGPEVRYSALGDGAWSPAVVLAAAPAVDPVLATDDTGRVFAAWSDREEVFATELDDALWLPPISLGAGTNPTLAAGNPVYIAWTRPAEPDHEVVVASLRSTVPDETGLAKLALWAAIGLVATAAVMLLRQVRLRKQPPGRRGP